MATNPPHVLAEIDLPSRYESLVRKVGVEVTRILHQPSERDLRDAELVAMGVLKSSEGSFIPVHGITGSGKTTFLSNLSYYNPNIYFRTVEFTGEINYDELSNIIDYTNFNTEFVDNKVLPIIVDHRESNPPDENELSEIKRFLRKDKNGKQAILFWLFTNKEKAEYTSKEYIRISGKQPVDIPLYFIGVDRNLWGNIAELTIRIVNRLEDTEGLGIDFNVEVKKEHRSVGEYLRHLSLLVTARSYELLHANKIPISVNIVFISESSDQGILGSLTSSSRYGLASHQALLGATRNSSIGRWWKGKEAILSQAILTLDVRIVHLTPTAVISILAKYGDDETKALLGTWGIKNPGPTVLVRNFENSDYGKILIGTEIDVHEARGAAGVRSNENFKRLAEHGFTSGQDKIYNKAIAKAIEQLYLDNFIEHAEIVAEKKLMELPIIPDILVTKNDRLVANEFAWRSGEFNTSGHRADIAFYVLNKIKGYHEAMS